MVADVTTSASPKAGTRAAGGWRWCLAAMDVLTSESLAAARWWVGDDLGGWRNFKSQAVPGPLYFWTRAPDEGRETKWRGEGLQGRLFVKKQSRG